MTVRPLYDHILLKRDPQEEVTKGGIALPEGAKERSQMCEVIAVGKGRILKDGSLLPCHVFPGEKVLIGQWVGDPYANKQLSAKHGEGEYLIIREEAINCVVNHIE